MGENLTFELESSKLGGGGVEVGRTHAVVVDLAVDKRLHAMVMTRDVGSDMIALKHWFDIGDEEGCRAVLAD